MIVLSPSQITAVLGSWIDPYLQQDIVSAKIIQEITIERNKIRVRLQFPYPLGLKIDEFRQSIVALLHTHWPDHQVELMMSFKAQRHQVQPGLKPLSMVKNIIAVASGKGGVGKSTVAVNLAVALQKLGARVALLDADIYGPSQPRLLGKQGVQAQSAHKRLIPVNSFGIQSISIGYLLSDEQLPMVWRGPMVSSALQQLLNDTDWQEVDYMIIDLPPGTGDIQLTMAQKIALSGALIVTTPQDIALLDAKKAYQMFSKLDIPVLGIVENMSWHICRQCGWQEAIFGQEGGKRMAAEFSLPLLAQLPLDQRVQHCSDQGTPVVIAEQGALAKPYWELAYQVAATLAHRPVDYQARLSLVVE